MIIGHDAAAIVLFREQPAGQRRSKGAEFLRRVGIWLCLAIVAGCTEQPAPETRPARETTAPPDQKAAPLTTGAAAGRGQLRIAAASDLKFALEEVQTAFYQTHPGAAISVTYGSSGSFFAQLSNDAPFDLFLSADIDYARRLADLGRGVPGGAFPYARGHIVLWGRADAVFDLGRNGLAVLRDGGVQKIAIANPKTAPYGRAALAALQNLGLYEAVEPKLVNGENVAQAAQMVESGAADLGIIALSLAVSPALRDEGRYWQIPDNSYPPIIQGGIVLSWAKDAALAGEFREFLLGGAGASILERFGFGPPGE